MRDVTLGTTGITTPQNAFGALPLQRIGIDEAVRLLRRAFEGGMTYFDTARAYSDSEEKIGRAFGSGSARDRIFIATKTMATTPQEFWAQLDESLRLLRCDHVDVYQFHCADRVFRPGDGTGMYECMLKAKEQGKVAHIGITAHKLDVAREAATSGLYEVLQFPFSYLAGPAEEELVRTCAAHGVGFVCMKGLAGGLIRNARAAMAYLTQFPNALPIWGIQREAELDEWLQLMDDTPAWTPELTAFVERERTELAGDFCRGCGYCEPCPRSIIIHHCARMSLMLRRCPSAYLLSDHWQREMARIDDCVHCNQCAARCPYELDTPALLQRNLADYRRVLAGEASV